MFGFFKFVLYLGVVAGVLGFALPYMHDHPTVASLPDWVRPALSFGGLGLMVLGLVGRSATRPNEAHWE